ncbi:MAG: hypothetical protein WA323_28000, partial [Candidatus Nitrosopolaris sp.]
CIVKSKTRALEEFSHNRKYGYSRKYRSTENPSTNWRKEFYTSFSKAIRNRIRSRERRLHEMPS